MLQSYLLMLVSFAAVYADAWVKSSWSSSVLDCCFVGMHFWKVINLICMPTITIMAMGAQLCILVL